MTNENDTILMILADIRMKAGVGHKPMLTELADAIAQKIPQWILIDDRPPPDDGTSILMANNEKVTLAWCEDGVFTELLVWNSVHDTYKPEPLGFTPTHWQPLPEPPK